MARGSPLRRSCYRNAQGTREEVMAATVPFGNGLARVAVGFSALIFGEVDVWEFEAEQEANGGDRCR